MWTGDPVAYIQRTNSKTIEEVLSCKESYLENSSRHELKNIDSHQAFLHDSSAAIVFWWVFVCAAHWFRFGLLHLQRILIDHRLSIVVFILLQDVLQMMALSPSGVRRRLSPDPVVLPALLICSSGDLVDGISHVHDGGSGDHDDLEDPEAHVRERGEVIIAYVVTTRLLGVAGELGLLIRVDGLASDCCEHNAEDDEHGEPHFPHEGGVVVDLFQETSEKAPAHVALASFSTRICEERIKN